MPQLKPTRGIRLNKSHPLARGLVSCWLFNEGSGNKVFDLSRNGNIGTFAGTAPSWTSGKFGSAVLLPGDDEYIGATKITGLTRLAISIWVKAAQDDPAATRIFFSNYDGTNRNEFGGSSTNNRLNLYITNTLYYYWDGIDWDDTHWHHLATTWDGTTAYLYFDGVQYSSTGSGDPSDNNTQGLTIGDRTSHPGAAIFSGLLDLPMIYNRALSPSEIALLYREPFCMFERAWIPKLIGGQIVELAGSSVALSSLSATAKAMRKVGGNVVSTSDVAAILNLFRSLLYIESNWKREALFNGMTANAFKLGTTLSLGWFWVRVAGCSVLYRGSSMGEIDFVNILAVAEQNAREISPPSYISHNSGSTYFYVVRRFNNCGYQERTLAASVKVSIESNGELAEPQPNKVFDSGAELVDSNKILLVWYYCPLEQKSQPMCFNVYYDGRTGQINYENPLAIIGYKGRKFYRYQCGALEAGRYLFAIRTEDASGIENSSLARLRIQFDPTNPAAIDILSVEGV